MDIADQNYRAFMLQALAKAINDFCMNAIGSPVFGWRDRSVGSKVKKGDQYFWLRVVSENKNWIQKEWWEGNEAANAIKGIPKPQVLNRLEWERGEFKLRAELMTFMEGKTCSVTPELRSELDLPDRWWAQLRCSLDRLAACPTKRVKVKQEKITRRVMVFFGDELDTEVTHWATAHGDFHWGNLQFPNLSILDWEGWGKAPVGYDAATLYCYSLLIPSVADQVYKMFSDILNTRDGVIAQLYVITRLLRRIDHGDSLDLAGPLHRHAKKLLSKCI